MGKRARKTRWRALDIVDDDHSDSEESNTNSSALSSGRYSRSYRSNGLHSKYPYSSQSTPARRRYQYDGSAKTTRSSSTTSENKITFNEDEYTRITTPRQDVLFKKGYLNKPKSYQSQTSTGNSTISTGYSTENGTPDHQSTDLDYESQFVFPNGFVDTNGIYYVNSYEPYPLMLFNPPTYYQEFSNKTKRCSTGSLSESVSPHNEESASQDFSQSGGEASNSVSDYSSGAPVYNMLYPGYYVNGTSLNGLDRSHSGTEPVKKLKKRRERKSSKTVLQESSENTDGNSSDEDVSQKPCIVPAAESPSESAITKSETSTTEQPQISQEDPQDKSENAENEEESKTVTDTTPCDNSLTNGCADTKTEYTEIDDTQQAQLTSQSPKHSVLKPDAEEFVPRIYQPMGASPHIKMLPPNFVPIPLVSINDFGGPNFNHHAAFIPPGFPINFIPHHPGQKIFPPVPGFVNFAPPVVHDTKIEEIVDQNENQCPSEEKEGTATPSHTPVIEETRPLTHNKTLDIATVVSKLEEAAKLQERENNIKETAVSQALSNGSNTKDSFKFNNKSSSKRNYFRYRNNPRTTGHFVQKQSIDSSPSNPGTPNQPRHSPERNSSALPITKANNLLNQEGESIPVNNNTVPHTKVSTETPDKYFTNKSKYINKAEEHSHVVRNSPERFKRNWKTNGHQNNYQNGFSSPRRQANVQHNTQYNKHLNNSTEKKYTNGDSVSSIKNYSEMLKKEQVPILSPVLPKKSSTLTESVKQADTIDSETTKQSKPKPNQWISVSNRKKKKNKNVEENGFESDGEVMPENLENNTNDLYEKYDINELIDVIPPSKQETQEAKQDGNKNLDHILTNIAQTQSLECKSQETLNNIPEVSDIEKRLIAKEEEKHCDQPIQALPVSETSNENLNVDITTAKDEEDERLDSSKEPDTKDNAFKQKKPKKGSQKPLTKKVIITDIDLSMTVEEIKTPVKKVVKKIEEHKSTSTTNISNIVATSAEPTTEPIEPTEKKSKKKKKKQIKQVNSSNSTLNNTEDSYDFLLENSVLTEIVEKTNDEISLELDKLIQKGMYSSLQEKMKSINVETEADGFFKVLDSVVSPSKENISAGNGFMKAPDFNRIFQSTRQFLKPNMALPIRALDLL
ncbi:uncharacterized protein LOC115876000 isoform X2 [Sitophilus oryzae]|uniref:Uncharacterized protein LOC115876000 isoform X2 n=1 Tax=Sitophilus oryzae TaxID=7048 RepID=A0A6J2X957_SITOR|nr:uncharacterized protein LOC115876000 isoform X2 [Sitophilus oryzae]